MEPIEVTESGIVIDVSPVQYKNALSPIEVTESGIVIDVSPEQTANAMEPIEVTESGISTLSIPRMSKPKNCVSTTFVSSFIAYSTMCLPAVNV